MVIKLNVLTTQQNTSMFSSRINWYLQRFCYGLTCENKFLWKILSKRTDRNKSHFDLQSKSINWFLYDRDLRREIVNYLLKSLILDVSPCSNMSVYMTVTFVLFLLWYLFTVWCNQSIDAARLPPTRVISKSYNG